MGLFKMLNQTELFGTGLSIKGFTDIENRRIGRIIQSYVGNAYAEKDMNPVRKVGVDETSVRTWHKYMSVRADISKRKVLVCTDGRCVQMVGLLCKEQVNTMTTQKISRN